MGNMILKKMYFPPEQIEMLKDLKKDLGISVSEQVRRAIAEYLKKKHPGRETQEASRRGVVKGKE